MLKTTSPGLDSFKSTIPSFGKVRRAYSTSPKEYSDAITKRYGDQLKDAYDNTQKEKAIKFISGDSSLMGSSIVSGATNKIVGFNRNIKEKPNSLKTLIENLSSNIFNNNSVQNIFNNKTEKTPEKKEKGFKPFGGFFDRIKEALAFVTFFGSKKNLDRIRENIENLKKSFTETFDVAKLLRKAINKIFKELSEKTSGGFGGGGGILGQILNAVKNMVMGTLGALVPGLLPKKVPTPRVAAPAAEKGGNILTKIPKMLGGGKAGIGKLLLGGGALFTGGLVATSALSQPGGEEEIQSAEQTPEVPGNLLDRFNSILDRFDKILDNLMKGGKPGGKPSGKPAASSGGEKGGKPASPPEGPGGDADSNIQAFSGGTKTAEEMALVQTVMQQERAGYTTVYGGKKVPQLTEMTLGEVYEASKLGGTDRLPGRLGGGVIPYAKDQYNSSATGAPQLMPATLKGLLDSGKLNKNQKFSPEVQNEIILTLARDTGVDPTKPLSKKDMDLLGRVWASFTQYHGQSNNTAGSTLDVYQKNLEKIKKEGFFTPGVQTPVTPVTPVTPGAQKLQPPAAQPPAGTQQNIQVIPFNPSQPPPQVQPSAPGGGISAPPPPRQNGPTAPFYSSGNPDNFLTLYSRMVYNIVDG